MRLTVHPIQTENVQSSLNWQHACKLSLFLYLGYSYISLQYVYVIVETQIWYNLKFYRYNLQFDSGRNPAYIRSAYIYTCSLQYAPQTTNLKNKVLVGDFQWLANIFLQMLCSEPIIVCLSEFLLDYMRVGFLTHI